MTAWMSNEFGRPRPGVLCEGLAGGEVSERLLPRAPRARQTPRGNTAGFWGGGTEGANRRCKREQTESEHGNPGVLGSGSEGRCFWLGACPWLGVRPDITSG